MSTLYCILITDGLSMTALERSNEVEPVSGSTGVATLTPTIPQPSMTTSPLLAERLASPTSEGLASRGSSERSAGRRPVPTESSRRLCSQAQTKPPSSSHKPTLMLLQSPWVPATARSNSPLVSKADGSPLNCLRRSVPQFHPHTPSSTPL